LKILIPFSRTSYCAYLINPLVILYFIMLNDQPFHLNYYMIVLQASVFTSFSFIAGAIFMIMFETPFIKIIGNQKEN
jgi:uncharacterized integral membrane protein